MAKLKAPLVLMVICAVICGLLIWAYQITYKDTTGIITDKLKNSLAEIYGENTDTEQFEMLKNEDGSVKSYDGIISVLKNGDNETAFEIIADGYVKNGLHFLVGFDRDGNIAGISMITFSETKDDVKKRGYLDEFSGKSSADEVDDITGATYSSKGLRDAVNIAVNIYSEHKEELFNE